MKLLNQNKKIVIVLSVMLVLFSVWGISFILSKDSSIALASDLQNEQNSNLMVNSTPLPIDTSRITLVSEDKRTISSSVYEGVYSLNKLPSLEKPTDTKKSLEIKNRLETIRNQALSLNGINKKDWLLYEMKDLSQLAKEPPSYFAQKKVVMKGEIVSEDFLNPILEQFSQYRAKGDSVPLFLVDVKKPIIKIVFQREFGNGDYVVLTFEKDAKSREVKVQELLKQESKGLPAENINWFLTDVSVKENINKVKKTKVIASNGSSKQLSQGSGEN